MIAALTGPPVAARHPHAAAELDGAVSRLAHHELAEHVATYAAERGDTELEQICDDVLADLTDESVLLAVVSGEPELQEAVERGRNAGWRSRTSVQDAFERATLTITGRTYAEVAAEISPTPVAATMSFAAVGRLLKDSLDAQAAKSERALRWLLGDAKYEEMRAQLGELSEAVEDRISRHDQLVLAETGKTIARGVPPDYRLREQVYRIRYNQERSMAVEVDGVSWPVDLGEAG